MKPAQLSYCLRHNRQGFTLLEMLASVTITVILVLLLTNAFTQTNRAWLQSEDRVSTFSRARIGVDYLAQELAWAFVGGEYSLLGDQTNVAFVMSTKGLASLPDLTGVRYMLVGNNGISALRRVEIELQASIYSNEMYGGYVNNPASPNYRIASWGKISSLGPPPVIQNPAEDAWPTYCGAQTVGGIIINNIVDLKFRYWQTNSPATGSAADTEVYWNSKTTSPIPGCWVAGGAQLQGGTLAMQQTPPAGIEVAITVVDDRTARRLASVPFPSAAWANITNQSAKTFVTFIPTRLRPK